MASRLLVPILLGAICMLTVVTARERGDFKDSQIISMPTATTEKDLVFLVQWGYSYCCPKKSESCCLTPYLAPDFILQSIRTVNGEGEFETNCNGPLFDVNKLSLVELAYIKVYWPSLNCSYDDLAYWKVMWETYGRCTGLSQSAWFKLAIKLFQPEFVVGLNHEGIVPGGKYRAVEYKKGLESVVGHKVGLLCNTNSATGERQLYEVLICYSQDDKKVIDCDSNNLPSPGDLECTGKITLPRKPCKPSSAACDVDA